MRTHRLRQPQQESLKPARLASLRRGALIRIASVGVAATVATAGALTFAQPAHAWPNQCRVQKITINGKLTGAISRCRSGTGKHQAWALCADNKFIWGPLKSTGTHYWNESWVECSHFGFFRAAKAVGQSVTSR